MRTYILTAFGLIFWLAPLVLATAMFWQHGFYEEGFGFYYDSLPLLGVPLLMIGLTIILTRVASQRPLPGIVIVACSSLAFIAAYCWLGIWGRGV
jgi:hypothetical protein